MRGLSRYVVVIIIRFALIDVDVETMADIKICRSTVRHLSKNKRGMFAPDRESPLLNDPLENTK